MLSWITLSVISACMSAVWSLTVKAGLGRAQAASLTAWYSAGAAILLTVAITLTGGKLGLNRWGSLAGAFAGVASVALAKSFVMSPNPGFSMGVFRMQAVVTALASYLLFGAPLDRVKVIGMLIACGGVALLARSTDKTDGFQTKGEEEKDSKDSKDGKDSKDDSLQWLWLAAGAGVVMSVKDLATKHALTTAGASLTSTLLSCSVAQVIVTTLAAYLLDGTIDLETKKGVGASSAAPYVAAASAAFAMYQGTVIAASKAAPNVGMVKAIDSLGLVLTTLGSHFLYGSALGTRSLEAVGVILAGVLVMCFSTAETRWWNKTGVAARKGLCSEWGLCRSKGYDYRVIDAVMGWGTPS